MTITPVMLANVSKKAVAPKGSLISDLAKSAMAELGGVTPARANKTLPHVLDADTLVKAESKQKVKMSKPTCESSYSPPDCGVGYSMSI